MIDSTHPAIELALEVRAASDGAQALAQRPPIVPREFPLSYIPGDELALHLWLPRRVDRAAVNAVIGQILREERLVGILRLAVQRAEFPLLLLSREPLLDRELIPDQTTRGLYEGGGQLGAAEIQRGFTYPPDEYQSLWWSTLADWEGDFLIELSHQWYAEVTQRVERLLGFPPRRVAAARG